MRLSRKFPFLIVGTLLSTPVIAGPVDVATDELYSDDVTLTTADGAPLDIDGDGNTDLAVGSNQSDSAGSSRYYLGSGDGTFSEPVLLSNGKTSEIVAAHLNSDSFIDLVQGRRDITSLFYLGDGAGGLGAATAVSADTNRVLSVAVGDLDLDGDLDLVTGTGQQGGEPGTNPLQTNRFYLNTNVDTGTPGFAAGAEISADQDDTRSIALADLDGDTDLDVVVGNDETTPGSDKIYLNQFFGSGTVSFAAGVEFAPLYPNDQTSRILIGDLDNDGWPDIVTLNTIEAGFSPGINRFFLNESELAGTLQMSAGADVSPDTDRSNGGALADFDGDGDLDLAVANVIPTGPGESARNRLYLNQFIETGSVSFAAGIDISDDEHQSRELTAADINGDGYIDIVVGNQPVGDAPGRDRRLLNNGTDDPFTNVVPVIDTQAAALETAAGTALTIDLDDVTVTDIDNVFPADFTLTVQSGTSYTVTDNTITPEAGFAGDLVVPVIVSDGTDDSAAFNITVTVAGATGGNNPPAFTSTAPTDATESEVYTYAVTASDADTGAALVITAPIAPAWLKLIDNGDGTATLTGTPAAGDAGDYDVSLEVSDGTDSTLQNFTITVTGATGGNNPPAFTSTAPTDATESEVYTYDVIASDPDAGAAFVITAPTVPAWLTLTDNGDGTATLTGTPASGDVGEHDISIEVSDGTDTAVQNFTITVASVESPAPPTSPPDQGDDGGGGGALGLVSLFALFAFGATGARRRIPRHGDRRP